MSAWKLWIRMVSPFGAGVEYIGLLASSYRINRSQLLSENSEHGEKQPVVFGDSDTNSENAIKLFFFVFFLNNNMEMYIEECGLRVARKEGKQRYKDDVPPWHWVRVH